MRPNFGTPFLIPNWAKRPIPGRGYKPFSTEMVDVSIDDLNSFKLKKIVRFNNRPFSLFSNENNDQIMQSWDSLRFMRCKPGEQNINAKLTDKQGIDIFVRASNGEDAKLLAKEHKVSTDTVIGIKNFEQRTQVTLNWLHDIPAPGKAKIAKRLKGRKLSPQLAQFIRKDRKHGLSIQQLTKKYCVSQSTIRRILNNQMYKESA